MNLARIAAVILIFALAWSPCQALAQTVYVDDLQEVMMRSGPDTNNRIVLVLKSGRALEVLETSGGWSRVRTSGGTEGWVVSRYLTPRPPASIAFNTLEKAYEELLAKSKNLEVENETLKNENLLLAAQAEALGQKAQQLEQDYEALKLESESYFEVKEALEEAKAILEEQKGRADQAVKELENLRSNKGMTWMAVGAGILLAGIILGIVLKPKRRRSSFGF
ncbi:MAG: TIGR04211 family SH3 domain-containing protein [Desulfatibacillaceae bacterium]|nr:TIGR04211 family SH3 domain-containing protein [Desulfatibacillaceae bacterium]